MTANTRKPVYKLIVTCNSKSYTARVNAAVEEGYSVDGKLRIKKIILAGDTELIYIQRMVKYVDTNSA